MRLRLFVALSAVATAVWAQAPQRPQVPAGGPPTGPAAPGQQTGQPPAGTSAAAAIDRLRPNYVLRIGDQILIRAFEMEEISERPYRIDGDGFVSLPVLGRTKAAGLSVESFEAALVEALKKFVRVPQVTVTVVQFSSEPIFFVGAFKAPGIYPLEGKRTLVEMMSSIGGLQPTASRRIKITRRKEFGEIPLPNAIAATDGSGSSIEINMASLRDNVNPAEDILLQPFDVVSVERAELIYVTGEVARTGAFELQEKDSMSVIQVLSLAGGLTRDANANEARILRPVLNTSRRAELPLSLNEILKGQQADLPLLPNDVLYIPRAGFGKNLGRSMLVLVPTIMSVVSIAIAATR